MAVLFTIQTTVTKQTSQNLHTVKMYMKFVILIYWVAANQIKWPSYRYKW